MNSHSGDEYPSRHFSAVVTITRLYALVHYTPEISEVISEFTGSNLAFSFQLAGIRKTVRQHAHVLN
ncbi:MAG TPA: hypothetical protein EYQ00_07670 [Dehalococcoidia bacterium]|nr:hypothetical protein [Dehalococcoidia bacterium]